MKKANVTVPKAGTPRPYSLSWRAAFQCSPYTEGCGGGFSYLTFKMFQEVGIPLISEVNADCDPGVYEKHQKIVATQALADAQAQAQAAAKVKEEELEKNADLKS